MKTGVRCRILGSLLGLVVGDALGAPVEFMSAKEIAARFPGGVTDYPNFEGSPVQAGEVTDDTEMAVAVASSLTERGGLDMDDVVVRLVEWEAHGGTTGPSTSEGITALGEGIPWREAGGIDTPSSGCLPRCAPVALVMPEREVVEATLDCCRATHRHPLALAASVAQNLILCHLVNGEGWEAAIKKSLLLTPALPAMSFMRAAVEGNEKEPGAVDILVEAIALVASAACAEEAIRAAVEAGGDTDTRGAVAGALAGARWGIEDLPTRWIEGCRASEEVRRLGDALVELRFNSTSAT